MAKLDTSRLHAKLRALEAAGREADEAAVQVLGEVFIDRVVELTPRDTNRAVNGWIEAGRAAGVTTRPLLPYNVSSRRQQWLDELAEEEAALARTVERRAAWKDRADQEDRAKAGMRRRDGKAYARRSRTASYKANVRKLRVAERRLARVREEIEKAVGSEFFVFFSARFGKRAYSTVRTTVYGGTGRRIVEPGRAAVEFVNREPHVRLIERNPNLGHPIATAMAVVRSLGYQVAGKKWLEVVRRRAA